MENFTEKNEFSQARVTRDNGKIGTKDIGIWQVFAEAWVYFQMYQIHVCEFLNVHEI